MRREIRLLNIISRLEGEEEIRRVIKRVIQEVHSSETGEVVLEVIEEVGRAWRRMLERNRESMQEEEVCQRDGEQTLMRKAINIGMVLVARRRGNRQLHID